MVRKKTAAALIIIILGISFFSYLIIEDLLDQPVVTNQTLSTNWTFETGGGIHTSPAVSDIDGDGEMEIVFGSNDNKVYAINSEDGSELWSLPTSSDVASSPSIADLDGDSIPEVVVGGTEGMVHVLNGEDGSRLWTPPSQTYLYQGNMFSDGEEHRYQVTVSNDAESMRVILLCPGNDYDLYLGHEYEPTTNDYDFRGYSTTGEDITVDYPNEGLWHIMVRSFSGTGEYELTVFLEYEGQTNEEDYQFEGSLQQDEAAYHTISVPQGVTEAHLVLNCGENDFDLYGGLGYQPTTSNYDFRGFTGGGEDILYPNMPAGQWILMVHSYAGSGPYRLLITLDVATSYMEEISGNSAGNPVIADVHSDGNPEVLLATKEGSIYCLEGSEGEIVWSAQIGSTIYASPVVSDVNADNVLDIIVASNDGWVIALDGTNGTDIWTNGALTSSIQGMLMADVNGDFIEDAIVTAGEKLITIDGTDGSTIWQSSISTSNYLSPSIRALYDGSLEIILSTDGGDIRRFDAATGVSQGSFTISGGLSTSPLVADVSGDGLLDIIVGDTEGRIYAIDGTTYDILWDISIPDTTSVTLAAYDLGDDETMDLIVGSDNHMLYVFELSDTGYRIYWQDAGGTSDFSRLGSVHYLDPDNDALSSYSEAFFGCSWVNNDTDSDQILDGIEIAMGLSPILADSDFDALGDFEEVYVYHTLGNNPDTDSDLLSDNLEVNVYFTDPLLNDSDADQLIDGLEVLVYGSSPYEVDSDNDTILDGLEVLVYGSSPAHVDTDLDSIPDYQEIFVHGTNPNATDSDHDLLSDYAELMTYQSDPLNPDSDADGALDGQEAHSMGTEVLIADSDGDSYLDGWEQTWGFDPLDANVPFTQPLVFYGPILLGVVAVALVGFAVFRWERSDKDDDDEIEAESEISTEQEPDDTPTDAPADVIYDLMDEVEKPWLYDGRDPLVKEGDVHDFMQWLIKEESQANDLIERGALRTGVERLEKLLSYVEKERDMLTSLRGQDTYNRIWERIAKRVDEVRTILN